MRLSTDILHAAVARHVAEEAAGTADKFEVSDITAVIGGAVYKIDAIEVSLRKIPEPELAPAPVPAGPVERQTSTGFTMRLAADNGELVE